jgi:hypothetical protein
MDEDQIKLEKKIKAKYKKLIPYKVYIPDHCVRNSVLILNMTDLCYKDESGAVREIQSNTSYADMYYEHDLPSITSSNKILNKMVSGDYSYIINGLQMELINLPRDINENNLYFCITQGNSWDVKKEFMSYNMFVFKYDHGFREYNLYHKDWHITSKSVLAWSKI